MLERFLSHKIIIGITSNYKPRGGECAVLLIRPHIHMCRLSIQAQISVTSSTQTYLCINNSFIASHSSIARLNAYRFKLTCFGSSEKTQIQNCLTASNIQLANVVSDTFGKSSMRIIDYLLEIPNDTDFDFVPLLRASMLHKVDDIRLALDGMITPEHNRR